MTPPAGTYTLGPDNASLRVLTTRQGLASKVGHDLVLEVGSWEATLTTGDAPTFELSAHARSFKVLEGTGGAKPMTDGDRTKIVENMESKVLGTAPVQFRSTGPGQGDLEIKGTTKPASFDLTIGDDGAIEGRATIVQSDWGIKPYSALMGALKVSDEVVVTVLGKLPQNP